MTRPIVHFAHGNSFPAETYRMFLQRLGQHYDVHALPIHAHDPNYPVRNGWHELTQELLAAISQRDRRPVILVGHSMGGVLCLMAANARPDLVRAVVLLDAPVVAGWRAALLRMAKTTGIDKRFSPARFSERRRDRWDDREQAYQHFASRSAFRNWQPEALRDYVEHGLVDDPEGGVRLRFTRETETEVYRTLPHHIGALVKRDFPVPVGFVGGIDSLENRQAGLRATRKLVGANLKLIPGGHLFPMEHPDAAAKAVHQMIQNLLHDGERQR